MMIAIYTDRIIRRKLGIRDGRRRRRQGDNEVRKE